MTSSAVHAPLDPFRTAKFPVQLGRSLTQTSSLKRFSSIKYNHKPKHANPKRTSSITESTDGPDHYNLTITDEDEGTVGTYQYNGRKGSDSTSCALIFDPESQTFTLERVESVYTFNLTSTPQETNTKKLQKQYPQLELDEAASSQLDDDLFGEVDDTPEADNPYDYRHFLAANLGSMNMADTPIPSTTATPHAQSPASTPLHHPHPKQAPEASRKRKQGDRQAPAPTTARPPKKEIPRVRLERRASHKAQAKPSENDGSLIIEMDDEKPSKKKSLRADMRGRPLPSGPISLRAAASSRSPGQRSNARSPPRTVQESDADDDSSDGDVEMLDLHNAARAAVAAPAPPVSVARHDDEEHDDDNDDDEDALEAELEHAFESQEEEEREALREASVTQPVPEDDAESEEE